MYANVVATLAALASAGALYLHWLRWRHDQRSRSLIVRAALQHDPEATDGWHLITVSMRSRSDSGYTAESIKVVWPPSGRIEGWWECNPENPNSPYHERKFAAPSAPKRMVKTSLAVAHAGQQTVRSQHGGPIRQVGDRNSSEFYVTRSGSGIVLLAIVISPEDDAERTFTRYKRIRL
jgi:hypothetical protein